MPADANNALTPEDIAVLRALAEATCDRLATIEGPGWWVYGTEGDWTEGAVRVLETFDRARRPMGWWRAVWVPANTFAIVQVAGRITGLEPELDTYGGHFRARVRPHSTGCAYAATPRLAALYLLAQVVRA